MSQRLRCLRKGSDDIVLQEHAHPVQAARRTLHRDMEFGDRQLVLDERPHRASIAGAPVGAGQRLTVIRFQETHAAIGKRVDHVRRTIDGKAVELRTGPIKITGLEKKLQPAARTIERTTDKASNLRRAEKPMMRDGTHNL